MRNTHFYSYSHLVIREHGTSSTCVVADALIVLLRSYHLVSLTGRCFNNNQKCNAAGPSYGVHNCDIHDCLR